MHVGWTASGACTSGSIARPRGATRRASGGGVTTSTARADRPARAGGLADGRLPRVARHGRPLHEAVVAGGVERRRPMQHAAVVPDDQVALPPLVAVAELRLGDEGGELAEQRAAVLDRHPDDVRGVGADEQCAAAVHGVGAHERVLYLWDLAALLVRQDAGPHLVAGPREVVDAHQPLHAAEQLVGQLGVGGAGAGELGGAALGRDDAARQQRAERRHLLEGAVAVPELVGELVEHPAVVGRDHLAGLDVEVRLALERRAGGRVGRERHLQRAEAAAEGGLALVVERLAGEDDDRVLLERRADLAERVVGQRAREVDVLDARGEDRGQRDDLHGRLPQCRPKPWRRMNGPKLWRSGTEYWRALSSDQPYGSV